MGKKINPIVRRLGLTVHFCVISGTRERKATRPAGESKRGEKGEKRIFVIIRQFVKSVSTSKKARGKAVYVCRV